MTEFVNDPCLTDVVVMKLNNLLKMFDVNFLCNFLFTFLLLQIFERPFFFSRKLEQTITKLLCVMGRRSTKDLEIIYI
jgi:hypothetical protein